MRGRLALIITITLVLLLLVVLNAASYVSVERTSDSEYNPDRSTYNSGSTGTRALYDFLNETGRPVTRWREAPGVLLRRQAEGLQPRTFVVVGATRIGFDEKETRELLDWVGQGGRLVIIDRQPDVRLLPASGDWHVSTQLVRLPSPDAHSDNTDEMTAGVSLAHAAAPSLLTVGVESVLPSRFASLIKIAADLPVATNKPAPPPPPVEVDDDYDSGWEDEQPLPTPPPKPLPKGSTNTPPSSAVSFAPVVHLTDYRGALLVDYPHGSGRIIILSDPFIVTNKGINQASNLRLAVNLLAGDGLVAFDEYHQGRRTSQNQLLSYFSGTPLLAMLIQLGLVVGVVFWTSGRRFARPLPVPQVDRRSSLEFVASMAELQQRARAYDLAIENIYTRIRRVLTRYAGVETYSPRALIAERVAARSAKVDRQELERLMFECEEAINGAPVDAKKSLAIIARLREIEGTLGLRMRSRDIRQAKEQKG